MKNLRNVIVLFVLIAGVLFNTTNAEAGKKSKNRKNNREKEVTIKTVAFSFDKNELAEIEQQLIENYLQENYSDDQQDKTVKVYNVDGGLFFEGAESIIHCSLRNYDFLFEYDSVLYYLDRKGNE